MPHPPTAASRPPRPAASGARHRPLLLLLALLLFPPLAAHPPRAHAAPLPTPADWGFARVAEWPLGTGETALGCLPADPDDPPTGDAMPGRGPMLLTHERLLDPVNLRTVTLPDRRARWPFPPGLLLHDAVAAMNGGGDFFLAEATGETRLYWGTPGADPLTLTRRFPGEAWRTIVGGLLVKGDRLFDGGLLYAGGRGLLVEPLRYATDASGATMRDLMFHTLRHAAGGELFLERHATDGRPLDRTPFFTGETLEARMEGALHGGFVVSVTRFVVGEARALYLYVDHFGAVRDLFELPVLPWPRRAHFRGPLGAFLARRGDAGGFVAHSPYEATGLLELHVAPKLAAALAVRPLPAPDQAARTLFPAQRPLPAPPRNLRAAAYDPVADDFALFGVHEAVFAGIPLRHKELGAFLADAGVPLDASFGDDGLFHLYSASRFAGCSFAVSPEGAVESFRIWKPALPAGTSPILSRPRATRTGEILLDDFAGARTLRFLPDGTPLSAKEGLVHLRPTERGAFAVAAGDHPSARPLLEFDLALNFQRRFADLAEPDGRVGTVHLLGLDARHRLHLVRFRDGLALQATYDQETGRALDERPLAFDPPAVALPLGPPFHLRHDGALVALFLDADGKPVRMDFPVF